VDAHVTVTSAIQPVAQIAPVVGEMSSVELISVGGQNGPYPLDKCAASNRRFTAKKKGEVSPSPFFHIEQSYLGSIAI
jgi:hypothetical protein